MKHLLVGDAICSLLDVDQQEDGWNKHYRSEIKCDTYLHQEAGEYSFTELVDFGYAKFSLRNWQTSVFTGENYIQRVLPKINSLSAHQGGSSGHRIRVQGTGFSKDVDAYGCEVAGETCTVTEASMSGVVLEIPAKDAGNIDFGKLAQDPSDT